MPEPRWRPASEAEAVGTPAVFLTWLHAVRGVALAGPAALATWRRDRPAAFAAAISEFAELNPTRAARAGGHPGEAGFATVRQALLHGHGNRAALQIVNAAERRSYTRADLLHAGILPEPAEKMLATLTPADLPALAASHLLDADIRPDTRLLWTGDPAEPWPLGAWLVGATVMFGDAADPDIVRLGAAPDWRA